MPQQTYTVRDPTTGRTVKLTGDSPPTEAELEQVFSQLHAGASRTAPDALPPGNTNGRSVLSTALEGAKGVVKSGLGLIEGGGEVLRSLPGIGPILSAGPEVTLPVSTKPSNTAQAVGKGVGDIAQFFVPGIATGGRLVRGAKAAALTLAQTGGDTTSAGVSGALSAALPGAGAAQRTATALEEGAERAMGRALGPTKEATKATAQKVVPGLIERGVKGSRSQMLSQANAKLKDIGTRINAETASAAEAGGTINGATVRKAFEDAAESLAVVGADGTPQIIPGTEPVLKRLAKLDKFVESMGDEIPLDKAVKIRRVWDKIVAKSGLYGQQIAASSTDNASAWTTREAAGAFRALINKGNTTLEELNQEYSFWKGVRDVLKETERRTTGQSGGLTGVVMGGAGATAGAMAGGDSLTDRFQSAVIGGLAGKNLVRLTNNPQWLTRVSVPLRTMLADALASGNAARIESAAKTILTATPSLASQ